MCPALAWRRARSVVRQSSASPRLKLALTLASPPRPPSPFVPPPAEHHTNAPNIHDSSSADLRTLNNLNQNLRQYARSTDTGARGQVAARIHSRLQKNYDGDTEDFTNFVKLAAARNVRLTMLRGELEDAEGGK